MIQCRPSGWVGVGPWHDRHLYIRGIENHRRRVDELLAVARLSDGGSVPTPRRYRLGLGGSVVRRHRSGRATSPNRPDFDIAQLNNDFCPLFAARVQLTAHLTWIRAIAAWPGRTWARGHRATNRASGPTINAGRSRAGHRPTKDFLDASRSGPAKDVGAISLNIRCER
jgi:hypothetical protein